MARVFGHGGLRLVLLSLLEDGPKHGYELIVALEERFMGMYRPSSGTVYPRLAAALEEEGLVRGTDVDGKRVYELTDAGRDELAHRRTELDDAVLKATTAVTDAVQEIQEGIRAAVGAVRVDLGEAVADLRRQMGSSFGGAPGGHPATAVAEEARRAAAEEGEQVRRMAEDLRRRAEREGREAARQARNVARVAARVGRQVGEATFDATEDVRREAVSAVDELRGHAAGFGEARAEMEVLLTEVAGWAAEAGEQLRRALPDEGQRARLRAALADARRAFVDTLAATPPSPPADQPSGDDEGSGTA